MPNRRGWYQGILLCNSPRSDASICKQTPEEGHHNDDRRKISHPSYFSHIESTARKAVRDFRLSKSQDVSRSATSFLSLERVF